MEYRSLGRSPLRISPITLGTMMFGGPTSAAESITIIHEARDAGINSIDTADLYNAGESEIVVGKALQTERDRWVLANRLVTSAIAGPRTLEQWRGYLKALDVRIDAEDEAFVDTLVPPGYASTLGYQDPSHKVSGRVSEGA